MLHITGCVVQVASDKADKAKKVADQKLKDLNQKVQEVDSELEVDSDEEPMIDIAKQRKQDEEARTAKKLTQAAQANERLRKQKEQQKNSKALVEAAQKSVNVDVGSKISHRSRLNPPANVLPKKVPKNSKAPAKQPKKAPAKQSVTEPVSTMQASKKRQARQSVTEPVSTKIAPKRRKTSPAAGDHDQRSGLTMLNPPAKNNTDVAKGREVQIKWGRTVYNAKVTKVLDGGSVNVCTKDKDPKIAKTGFKIVHLTEEQAKSYTPGKQHGFTNKKANAGFEVAGAHDD